MIKAFAWIFIKLNSNSSDPNGLTVTPTDDIQLLLNCAGIYDKPYTTTSQLLADTATLQRVIASNNAIDYLVRSTTFSNSFCANSTAMSYIGLSNYASNRLLADSTWLNAICNSTYFESVLNVKVPTMTSNTTPSGECFAESIYGSNINEAWYAFNGSTSNPGWASQANHSSNTYIGYKFTTSQLIKLCKTYNNAGSDTTYLWKNFKIQASNDSTDGSNGTWIDLYTGSASQTGNVTNMYTLSSSTKYQWYRFYIIDNYGANCVSYFNILQFYGREDV